MLKPRDLPWEKNGVLNPGVTIYNGRIVLLYRAVGDDHISRFGLASTTDGLTFNYASETPVFSPDPSSSYETRGVEDPRITFVGDRYAIVYVAASVNHTAERPNAVDWKIRVSLAFTTDFEDFERRGVILHSYNDKNAALFPVKWPDKFGDFYYLYHRRHPSIWLSRSRDLNTWEDVCEENCIVFEPQPDSWENDRIGIGSQPIYTQDGWLVFYHGRNKQGIYSLGAFLADFHHPETIIARLPYPLIGPKLPFETKGTIPNVIFCCGAVEAGDSFWVYYGGADHAIGGAYIKKKTLLDELKRYRLPISLPAKASQPKLG